MICVQRGDRVCAADPYDLTVAGAAGVLSGDLEVFAQPERQAFEKRTQDVPARVLGPQSDERGARVLIGLWRAAAQQARQPHRAVRANGSGRGGLESLAGDLCIGAHRSWTSHSTAPPARLVDENSVNVRGR